MKFLDRLQEHRTTLTADFVPAVEAQWFVDFMRDEYPDELDEWLTAMAVTFCTRLFSDKLRKERQRSSAGRFSDAAKEHAAGDTTAMSVFRTVHAIDAANTRRPVAEMTGADHRFVAGAYEQSGKRDLALAAFHRAVAKKVGARKTGEVFDEAAYQTLLDSMVGRKPTVKAVA